MDFQRRLSTTKNYLLAVGIAAVTIGGQAASHAQADVQFQRSDNIFPTEPSDRVTAGDINGDGLTDLILIGLNGQGFTIRLKQRDGSYTNGGYYLQSDNVTSATVTDFNGDGKNDLAVTKYGGTVGSKTNSVMVFTRSTRFPDRMALFTTIPLEDKIGLTDVVSGDFNGDGKADLATANSLGASASLILNNGDGTFDTPQQIAAGSGPWRARVANLDGDQADDVLLSADKSNGLFYARGATSGKFYGSVNIFPSDYFKFFAVGDLNQDGEQDLVTSDGSSLSIYRGYGWGDFRDPQRISTEGAVQQLDLADMNNDGRKDIVVVESYPHKLVVFKNLPGDNPFSRKAERDLPQTPATASSVITDLNGDEKLDVAVVSASGGNIALLENTGHSTDLQVDHNELSFPAQSIDSHSVRQTVTFHNDDDMAVMVKDLALKAGAENADFHVQSVSCDGRDVGGKLKLIAPHGDCSINITFQPESAGDHGATLSVQTDAIDDASNEITYGISLTGKGVIPDTGRKGQEGSSDSGVSSQTAPWKFAFSQQRLKWRLRSKKALQIRYASSQAGKLNIEVQRCKTEKKKVQKCQQVASGLLEVKTGQNTMQFSIKQMRTLGKGKYRISLFAPDSAVRAVLNLAVVK